MKPVQCDDSIKYLLTYFNQISLRRQSNGFGPLPISHSDLAAWARRNRIDLLPFEVSAIDRLEVKFLASHKPKATQK